MRLPIEFLKTILAEAEKGKAGPWQYRSAKGSLITAYRTRGRTAEGRRYDVIEFHLIPPEN